MKSAKLRVLPFVGLLLPLDLMVAGLMFGLDVLSLPLRLLRRRANAGGAKAADISTVTIQILNWDGLHLLKENLPGVIEAARLHSRESGTQHEILLVDNSSRDGSVDYLRQHFPDVRVVPLNRNYGFSIGNNKGFAHVRSDIVVLLNNDMKVAEDFLRPVLAPFRDSRVFAVASQIRFPDAERRREETGRTGGSFDKGFIDLRHNDISPEDEAQPAIPILWAGCGACAVDLRKLRLIGGFDRLYHPFYVEDVDISWQAWKRGWRCLCAPQSRVVHLHRGTSRPKFGDDYVDGIIHRNQFLFVWKNVTDMGLILQHLCGLPRLHGSVMLQKGIGFELSCYLRALARLPLALWRRAANLREYVVSDRDVLRFSK